MATRTAERIVAKYFGGDPWVRTESPVSSLDDRVTQGVLDGALVQISVSAPPQEPDAPAAQPPANKAAPKSPTPSRPRRQ